MSETEPQHRAVIDVDVVKHLGGGRGGQSGFVLEAAFTGGAGIVALTGRSGSGKSTLVRLIAGLDRPDRGRITLGSSGAAANAPHVLLDSSRRIDLPKHKRRIGLVFQDAHLFPHLSVRQNLLFGRFFAPKPDPGDVRLDPDAVIETLGIGHLLSRRTTRLSGGERQRVALGRALLSGARLLLMDEPLAALDAARKAEILPLIERLRDDFAMPIVYVSHAMDEVARLAETVVVLEQGRVVGLGTPQQVLGLPHGRGADGEQGRFGRFSVLTARAGMQDSRYGLTVMCHPAGALALPGLIGPSGREVRLLIRATDVALATHRPSGLSIRNVLDAEIAAISFGEGAQAEVELRLIGGERLAASVTRQAVDELGLVPGLKVFALVKAMALDESLA